MSLDPRTNKSNVPAEVRHAAKNPENVVGSYIIVDLLGQGGSGEVHRAWDMRVGRFVALKFLMDANPDRIERFGREAKMVARLSHPHIIPLYEFTSVSGRPFMTMRLVEGQTLAEVRLPPTRSLEAISAIADAVQYAHERGVIHRDIKPSNLMLGDDGHPWVMDFGVARAMEGGSTLTTAGSILGTLEYMPPEQAKAGRCDERSDVYSLGATLYHLMAGRPPFSGDTTFEIIYRLMRDDPPSLRQITSGVPIEVDYIVAKAMAKDPRHRYGSAREFGDDIRRHLAGHPISAGPVRPLTRVLKWTRRHRTLAWLGLMSLCMVILLAVGSVFYAFNVNRARNLTELRLAQALVAEGDAWSAGQRWSDARDRYAEARAIFKRQGVDDSPATLGMLDAGRIAGPPVWRIKGHKERVRTIEVLAKGDRFLSCSDDGELVVFDLRTGKRLLELATPGSKRYFVQGNAAQTEFVSGTAAGVLERWRYDGTTFQGPEMLLRIDQPVRAAAFSPDGKRLAVGDETGTLRLYDYESRKELWHVSRPSGALRALTISPDGRFVIAAGSDDTIGAWAVVDGEEISRVKNRDKTFTLSVEFLGNPPRLVSSSYGGHLTELTFPELNVIHVREGHTHAVPRVHLEPTSGGYITASYDGSVRRWGKNGKVESTIAVERGLLVASAMDQTGRFLVAGDAEGGLYLHRLGDESSLWFWGRVPEGTMAAQFSPNADFIFTQGPAQTMAWWDRGTGAELYRTFINEHPATFTMPMADMNVRTLNDKGEVSLWDVSRGRNMFTVRVTQSWARASVATPDGKHLVVGDLGGTVRMIDARSGEPVWTMGSAGVDNVWSLDVSPDGLHVAFAGAHGQMAVWQLPERRLLWKRSLERTDAVLGSMSFSADGRTLAVGRGDRGVSVVDAATGAMLHRLEGHAGEVRSVQFGGNARLVSVGGESGVRLWDTLKAGLLHSFLMATTEDSDPYVGVSKSGDDIVVVAGKNFLHTANFRESPDAWTQPAVAGETGVNESARLLTWSRWYARRHIWDWAWAALLQAQAAGAVVSTEERLQVAWKSGHWDEAAEALQRRAAEPGVDPFRIRGLQKALERLGH